MKKKLLILALCSIFTVMITGCGNEEKTNTEIPSQKQKVESKEETGTEITITSELEELVNKVNVPEYSSYETYYYTNDKITVDNMDNQVKLLIGVYNYMHNNNSSTSMTKSDMQTELEKIFGPKVKYTDESIKAGACYGFDSEYNNSVYTFNGGCGGLFMPFYNQIFTKAIDYNDKLEIFVQPIYVTFNTDNYNGDDSTLQYELYAADQETKIDTIPMTNKPIVVDNQTEKDYSDKLSTYKYTFIKDGENYYFYSVEKINK